MNSSTSVGDRQGDQELARWRSWSNTGWRSLLTATVPVRYVRVRRDVGSGGADVGHKLLGLVGRQRGPDGGVQHPVAGGVAGGRSRRCPAVAPGPRATAIAAAPVTGAEPVGWNTTVKLESSRSWKFFCRIASARPTPCREGRSDWRAGRRASAQSRRIARRTPPPRARSTPTPPGSAGGGSADVHASIWPARSLKRSRPSGGSHRVPARRSQGQP